MEDAQARTQTKFADGDLLLSEDAPLSSPAKRLNFFNDCPHRDRLFICDLLFVP